MPYHRIVIADRMREILAQSLAGAEQIAAAAASAPVTILGFLQRQSAGQQPAPIAGEYFNRVFLRCWPTHPRQGNVAMLKDKVTPRELDAFLRRFANAFITQAPPGASLAQVQEILYQRLKPLAAPIPAPSSCAIEARPIARRWQQ